MNEKLTTLWKQLAPYKGIIYFVFLLLFFYFSWEIAIDGDMGSDFIYLFHKNITPDWLHTFVICLTNISAWIIRLFPSGQNLVVDGNFLYFPDGGIVISFVWACTGIKQMFIFTGIMIFHRCVSIKKNDSNKYYIQFNPYWSKLWYIPLSCVILTIYSIIRVVGIVMLTNGHPERFDSLHDGLFRYVYYTIIFILWVIWEEKYGKKADKQ
jgi:exosortase/archaeosortase family protein